MGAETGLERFVKVINAVQKSEWSLKATVFFTRILNEKNQSSTTHQANKYEDELNYVCVRHRVEATQQCVGDGYSSRDPDAHSKGEVQNHAHGSSYISNNLEKVFVVLHCSLYKKNTK